jgi:hypothetical protein
MQSFLTRLRIGAFARATDSLSGCRVFPATDESGVLYRAARLLMTSRALALCNYRAQKVRQGALVSIFPAIQRRRAPA